MRLHAQNKTPTLTLFKCVHMIVESYNLYQTALELSNLIDQKILLAAMGYVMQVLCMKHADTCANQC